MSSDSDVYRMYWFLWTSFAFETHVFRIIWNLLSTNLSYRTSHINQNNRFLKHTLLMLITNGIYMVLIIYMGRAWRDNTCVVCSCLGTVFAPDRPNLFTNVNNWKREKRVRPSNTSINFISFMVIDLRAYWAETIAKLFKESVEHWKICQINLLFRAAAI